jgi:hypothetical protein
VIEESGRSHTGQVIEGYQEARGVRDQLAAKAAIREQAERDRQIISAKVRK